MAEQILAIFFSFSGFCTASPPGAGFPCSLHSTASPFPHPLPDPAVQQPDVLGSHGVFSDCWQAAVQGQVSVQTGEASANSPILFFFLLFRDLCI